MNLQEIREKYPQYNDLTDEDLTNRLYQKHYSDMPREEFDKRLAEKEIQRTPEPLPGGKAAAVMAGGTAGAIAGSGVGPWGTLAGGALGAAGGYYTHEGIKSGLKAAGVYEGPLPGSREMAENALREVRDELMWGGGAMAVGELARLGKAGITKWLASPEGRQFASRAKRQFGIDLGLIDITESRFLKGYPKIVGKFPVIGTPFREAAERKSKQVYAARERLLFRLGPSANLAELGVDLNAAAKNMYRGVRDEVNRRYEDAYRIADETQAAVPTEGVRQSIADELTAFQQRRPTAEGKPITRQKPSPLLEFAEDYANLDPALNVRQYDGMLEDLDVAMAMAKESGWDLKPFLNIKRAAEEALQNISHPEAAQAFKAADEYFAKAMRTFESPVAQKYARVEKRPFRHGLSKPGTLNADEIFNAVFNSKSPQTMRDLRRLVGLEEFRRVTRAHIDNAWQSAMEGAKAGQVFNPDTFARHLGLDNARSGQYAALEEALRYTPMDISDLKEFNDVVRAAFKEGVPDPSQFVSRRAVLGGARSALRAFLPFAGGASVGGAAGGTLFGAMGGVGGVTTGVAATYLARMGSKALARPRDMKVLKIMLDEAKPERLRLNAVIRLMRLAPEVFPEEQ